MKFMYAGDVASAFSKMSERPKREEVEFYLGRRVSSRTTLASVDLMDTIWEMREDYRAAWDAEYTPYRKQSALGRWDAEYDYWRRLQARFWEFIAEFKIVLGAPQKGAAGILENLHHSPWRTHQGKQQVLSQLLRQGRFEVACHRAIKMRECARPRTRTPRSSSGVELGFTSPWKISVE
jgi:hypothetical protein